MRLIFRTFSYLRPYRLLAITSILITILAAGAALLAPWSLKILVDNVLSGEPAPYPLRYTLGSWAENRHSLLIVAVIAGVAVAFATNALSVLENYINTKLEQRVVFDFR